MSREIWMLALSAAGIAGLHTLAGPDHYLPFVAMSRARAWSRPKTMLITAVCGVGHVLGSVVLGGVGIAIGSGVGSIVPIEARRGEIAAWLLLAFGLVYMVWGIKRSMHERAHRIEGAPQFHPHSHTHSHILAHSNDHHEHLPPERSSITPWVLFTVFVLGPCEPLIPLLMYPAATHSMAGLLLVTLTFSVITITTMVLTVLWALKGLSLLRTTWMEEHIHALAGGTIALSGAAIVFLGL